MPWSVTFVGCTFSGDHNGAPIERSGSCPTQSGVLDLSGVITSFFYGGMKSGSITSVKSDSFAGMGACT